MLTTTLQHYDGEAIRLPDGPTIECVGTPDFEHLECMMTGKWTARSKAILERERVKKHGC
jgi:hypothetical protein